MWLMKVLQDLSGCWKVRKSTWSRQMDGIWSLRDDLRNNELRSFWRSRQVEDWRIIEVLWKVLLNQHRLLIVVLHRHQWKLSDVIERMLSEHLIREENLLSRSDMHWRRKNLLEIWRLKLTLRLNVGVLVIRKMARLGTTRALIPSLLSALRSLLQLLLIIFFLVRLHCIIVVGS